MRMRKKDIAIIIPAYKADFLKAALDSICFQTCQDFSLYIGDDCSPEPIRQVVSNFENRLPIHYIRFIENSNDQFDVFRFDTLLINGADEVVAINPPHPEWESWMHFTYFWLRELRS